ncbi:Rab3 GTPase-activating protein catalytic subunit [Bienertia sinuspersici]
MEGGSLVSKARTAFNSAAARAERVLIDFKSDHRDSDEQCRKVSGCEFEDVSTSEVEKKSFNESKQFRWKPPSIGTKQEWHEKLRNIGRGRKGTEDTENVENLKMSFLIYDANIYMYNEKVAAEGKGLETPSPSDSSDANSRDIIPPVSVLKQLAVAIDTMFRLLVLRMLLISPESLSYGLLFTHYLLLHSSEKNYRSVKDFLTSSASSSPVRERASMGISAVKSLVLRGKEEKVASEFSDDEAWALIQYILDADQISVFYPLVIFRFHCNTYKMFAEGLTTGRKVGFSVESLLSTLTLPRDIHGAPPHSLIVKLSEVMGSFKTLRKMAQFWCRLVTELRRLWLEELYIPGIPLHEVPDLSFCLLYQQMQLINCCLSRKKRRDAAADSLESILREAGCDADGVPLSVESINSESFPYAKTNTGDLVLRLGVSHQAENLTLLETGEHVYAPLTQEGPLLTEDLAREAEEFVLRTGSVGAGCSQLLSDMQAFKAANPGCILEDFVRWHSPPDWTEKESGNDSDASTCGGDSTSSRGRLSRRMQKEGNLWLELWETAKPVPAVRQAPLFDEDLAVEGVLTVLEDITPSQLFGQLFQSLLGLGFVIAEAKLSTDENVAKLFYECKDFVVASCQGDAWIEKLDDICQVYETVEAMFVRPDDVMKSMKQPEDVIDPPEEPKTPRFKKLTQMFGRKNRSRKSSSAEQNSTEDTSTHQPFSNFLDNKSSLFSKKPPKPENTQLQANNSSGSDENDWTMV